MNHRNPALFCVLILVPALHALVIPEGRRPNLVVIVTDDQRFDALAANGNPRIHTPNLDRLAARGVRFTNAHVVMSLCSPSRAAILSGRYGSGNGVSSLESPLAPGVQTFAQLLRADGYRTALTGKWHLGTSPERAGFDRAVWFWANGSYHRREIHQNGATLKPAAHVDDYCLEQSVAFLEEAASHREPFLLMHCTQLPHMDGQLSWPSPEEFRALYDPTQLPPPSTAAGDLTGKPSYLRQVRNRTQAEAYGYQDPARITAHIRDYYAVVSQIDAILGRLFAALDRLGLDDNTWIVFVSDNGWLLGEHRMTSKVLAYSASERVPLIIAGPDLPAGTRDGIALNIDLAPTLLELAGIQVPPETDGRSLLPLLRDPATSWRSAFVYECLDGYGGTHPMLGAISANWSMIATWPDRATVGKATQPFVELYDLQTDPDERTNRAEDPATAAIRHSLQQEIDRHLARPNIRLPGAPD